MTTAVKQKIKIQTETDLSCAIERLQDEWNDEVDHSSPYGGFRDSDLEELSDAICVYWERSGQLILDVIERLVDIFDHHAPGTEISNEVLKALEEKFCRACGSGEFSQPRFFNWAGNGTCVTLAEFASDHLEDWVREQIDDAVRDMPEPEFDEFLHHSDWDCEGKTQIELHAMVVQDVLENWDEYQINKLLGR